MLMAPSWLVSSVGRALHRYRRGLGFKSRTGLNLSFRPYFHYCLSSVHYCEDPFHIYFLFLVRGIHSQSENERPKTLMTGNIPINL